MASVGDLSQYELNEVLEVKRSGPNNTNSGSYGFVFEVKLKGEVFIAKKPHTIFLTESTPEERSRVAAKFREECILLSQLHHPNIVKFIGVYYGDIWKTDLILVMEKLKCDLVQFLADNSESDLPLKLSILKDVASGLVYLHERYAPVVHRDLTAMNILLTVNNQAKIADVGVAKLMDTEALRASRHSRVPGQMYYMPPETRFEKASCTPKLDIFSFGHLTLHLVIGNYPEVFDIPDSERKEGYVEHQKRKRSLKVMGSDHCLYDLTLHCLLDDPNLRPNAQHLVDYLKTRPPTNVQDEGDAALPMEICHVSTTPLPTPSSSPAQVKPIDKISIVAQAEAQVIELAEEAGHEITILHPPSCSQVEPNAEVSMNARAEVQVPAQAEVQVPAQAEVQVQPQSEATDTVAQFLPPPFIQVESQAKLPTEVQDEVQVLEPGKKASKLHAEVTSRFPTKVQLLAQAKKSSDEIDRTDYSTDSEEEEMYARRINTLELGSRLQKYWTVTDDKTIITWLARKSVLCNLTDLGFHEVSEFLSSLSHPNVQKINSVKCEESEYGAQVVITQPFWRRGSLRDLIHGTDPMTDWDDKYKPDSGRPLPSNQIAVFGNQILEAMLYLYQQKFQGKPLCPLVQVQTGNIFIVDDGHCVLGGYENTLLGYRTSFYPSLAHHSLLEYADIIMFGRVMYEMCTGRQLNVVIPLEEDYNYISDDACRDVVRYIFKTKRGLPRHSVKKVSNNDFFFGGGSMSKKDKADIIRRAKAHKFKEKIPKSFIIPRDKTSTFLQKRSNSYKQRARSISPIKYQIHSYKSELKNKDIITSSGVVNGKPAEISDSKPESDESPSWPEVQVRGTKGEWMKDPKALEGSDLVVKFGWCSLLFLVLFLIWTVIYFQDKLWQVEKIQGSSDCFYTWHYGRGIILITSTGIVWLCVVAWHIKPKEMTDFEKRTRQRIQEELKDKEEASKALKQLICPVPSPPPAASPFYKS